MDPITKDRWTIDEIDLLVETELPELYKACNKVDANIIMPYEAFGFSAHEMLLFSAAIKYAGYLGKQVIIAPRFGTVSINQRDHV